MKKVLEIAEAEVGYQAIGSASKYFSELFPMRRSMPWCVSFIEWVFQKAYGRERALQMLCLQAGGFIWSAPSLLRFFKFRGCWHRQKVQQGWLVFLRTKNEWTNHVELVIDVTEDSIISIGGNCSGKVLKNTYKLDDARISGYGEIVYGAESDETEVDETCTE